MVWQKSLLLDIDAPVWDIKCLCHCVNLPSSLFVSNPAPELISDETLRFVFFCSVQLWRSVNVVSSELSLHVRVCGTKRVVGRVLSLGRSFVHTFGDMNF